MEDLTNKLNQAFWKKRKVFITGSTGLLGYWVTKYLNSIGTNLTILLRRDFNELPKIFQSDFKNISVVKGAVEDQRIINSTIKNNKIDTVFHFAAQTNTPRAFDNPISTFQTNIQGAWNVLEACRTSATVNTIIFPSSDKAYRDDAPLPYTEDSPLGGWHPYNASKSCADILAQSYYKSYNLPLCITRCGNLFGGGDLSTKRLIPSTIISAIQKKTVTLRSSGKFTRDFLYVEDGALATILLAEKMKNKKIHGEAFNFSYESPITVLSVVKNILDRMQVQSRLVVQNQNLKEVKSQYLSSKKAKKVLNWKPIFTLESGLDRTIEWYKSHLNYDFYEQN